MKAKNSFLIEPLESRIAPAYAGFYHDLSTDLKTKLDSIQATIDLAVSAGSLIPVVGGKISDAGKVIDNFSGKLKDAINLLSPNAIDDDVRTAIFNLIGPGASSTALRLLADNNGDQQITKADVIITHPDAQGDSILIDLNLHAEVGVSKSLAFDVGLGSLPVKLESNAAVQAVATLDYQHLTFGLSQTNGFLFHAATPNELKVGISAGLVPGSSLTGTIGFLRATITDGASDDPSKHTQLSASLVVDLKENGAPTVDFDVKADVDLQLEASFGESFPAIGADLQIHYAGLKAADAAPTVDFKHVHVNLAGAINGILEPIVKNLEKVLTPVQPVVDFITAPIPVLSDLSHAIGAGDITLLGIGGVAANEAPLEYQQLFKLVSTVAQVIKFADDFKADPTTHTVSIDLGDFKALVEGDSSADLRNATKALDIATAANGASLSNLVAGGFAPNFDISAKIDEAVAGTPLEGNPLISQLKETLDTFIHPDGINYSFPFLSDPGSSIFGMLLGRDADLFTLDAKLKVQGSFSHNYPIALGFSVGLEGQASADLALHLGYDTYGVREFAKDAIKNGFVDGTTFLDFLDGLYMTDATHAYVDASIAATAGLDVVIASVDVKGGVSVGVHINTPTNLHEVDGDVHKIHLRPELTTSLFQTTGSLDAFLDLEAKVGIGPLSVSKSFNLAHVTLLNFNGGSIPNPFTPPVDLHLASTHADDASIPEGTIRLNIGADAIHRGVSQNETAENYQIFVGGKPDTVVVLGFGYAQTFTGVKQIIGAAGDGNDSIIFTSAEDRMISSDVDLDGGAGNDQIVYHGSGRATIFGGADNDVVIGGSGINYLNGGEGNDNLTGGAGENHLGVITLNNQTYAEAGNDILTGGDGLNLLNGGDGNDDLFAGKTNGDVLYGGAGADQLTAGAGRSSFLGGEDNDTILWHNGDGRPIMVDGGTDRENNSLELTGGDFTDSFALSKNPADNRLNVSLANEAQQFSFLAHGIQNVLIEGGKGADALTVNSLTGTAVHDVGLNLSDVLKDQLNVGDQQVDVVRVNGGAGIDHAQIATEQDVINDQHRGEPIIGGIMKVTGLATYTVRLANVEDNFIYNAGSGNDETTLLSNTGPTHLLGGIGNDHFTLTAKKLGDLNNPANPTNPKDYLGAVTVDAGSGVNAVTFDESAAAVSESVILSKGHYSSVLLPDASFVATGGSYAGGVGVRTGSLGSTVSVASTLPGVKTNILGGSGDDVVKVGTAGTGDTGSLAGVSGDLVVNGGAGNNQLQLLDTDDASGNQHGIVSPTQVIGFAGPLDNTVISYGATGGTLQLVIEGSNSGTDHLTLLSPGAELTIHGHGGDDEVEAITLTKALTFSGDVGNDRLVLGAVTQTLDGIKSSATFTGGAGNDVLILQAGLSPGARSFDVLEDGVSFASGSSQLDATVESANVVGSHFADTFGATGGPSLAGRVNLNGNGGSDQLIGPVSSNTWTIDGLDAGSLNTKDHFVQVPNLIGNVFSDRFVFAEGGSVHGKIDGGNGSDTLDYSAHKHSVTANLTTGHATGIVGPLASIENVTGGEAADLLVGNGAVNILAGGAGRNVIIGGQAGDTLLGGADEDLLIGGTTDYDAVPAALAVIAKTWSGHADYLIRIAQLTTPGKFPGVPKLNATTVHDDMFTDSITGGAETRDWFFARLIAGGMDQTDITLSNERNG